MFKLTKKILSDFNSTKKELKENKKSHKKNVDNIIKIMKPYFDEIYSKCHTRTDWIANIKFCYDNSYDNRKKNFPNEFEWNVTSEKEYYYDYYKNKFDENIKYEFDYESECGDFIYYRKERKRQKYLRVYIHESWGYGGFDDVHYDFLMTDIMEDSYVRKEKLLKLEEIV